MISMESLFGSAIDHVTQRWPSLAVSQLGGGGPVSPVPVFHAKLALGWPGGSSR